MDNKIREKARIRPIGEMNGLYRKSCFNSFLFNEVI